jgi:hypothetical protein
MIGAWGANIPIRSSNEISKMVPLPPWPPPLEHEHVTPQRENYLSCASLPLVRTQEQKLGSRNLGAETWEQELRSKLPCTVSGP